MITKLMDPIDRLTNSITMYRLMFYFLILLWIFAGILTFFNLVPFDLLEFLISSGVISTSCYVVNRIFSRVLKAPTNLESVHITSLILIFLIPPGDSISDFVFFIVVSVLAMASKFVLAIHKKHIFNPAAFAVFITGILSIGYATWWIGNIWTLTPILIGGFLITKKNKKFSLVLGFLASFILATFYFSFSNDSDLVKTTERLILDSPVLFFSFVMLIEPLTSPTRKRMQIAYGLLVGLLAGTQFKIGPVYSTYEIALIAGNIFAYLVGFKYRLELILKEKIQLAPSVFEFVFSSNKNFSYLPGQYLEWTLSHKSPDSRGIRRYFTIASSPSEEDIRLGVKIELENVSSFKKFLVNLKKGDKIYAGQLSGDFVLPKKSGKFVFIAGGIGITPFRSIVKNALDNGQLLDAVLFYSCSTDGEFVYRDLFDSASKIGLKTIYICSHPSNNFKGVKGRISIEILEQDVSDFKDRIYYLSGPNALVNGFKKTLRQMGIRSDRIITDYFSGY